MCCSWEIAGCALALEVGPETTPIFGGLSSFCAELDTRAFFTDATLVPIFFDADEEGPRLFGLASLFFFEEVALLVRRLLAAPLPCFVSFDAPLLLDRFLLEAEGAFRTLATNWYPFNTSSSLTFIGSSSMPRVLWATTVLEDKPAGCVSAGALARERSDKGLQSNLIRLCRVISAV